MAQEQFHDLIDPASLTYHLENSPFGFIIWNSRLQMTYCSKAAAALFGCQPAELLEQPMDLFKFVHSDDAPSVAAVIAEITSGTHSHNESLNRNVSKDGTVIYCHWYNSALKDEQGQVINILSLVQDVTQQVETELALTKSREQLSLVYNSAIDPMWLIRVEGHNLYRFETINTAFTKVTGWPAEKVVGQLMEAIIPEASHELVRRKYNEALQTGRVIDYIEESLHPTGIKYGEIRVIPIMGKQGESKRILGIANDITEKVVLEKRLDAEREVRARQITSAAIRGQESERAKVSRELHDNVNQVLTTVKLYIELCIDQKIDVAAALPRCVAHLNDTISEIRDLSKQLSAPSLGQINFRETLSELAESVRIASQIHLQLELGGLSFAEMENELHLTLYRVVQEQLTNILRYANASRVRIAVQEEGDHLWLYITDDGIGFDVSQKRKGIGITNMQSRVEILNGHFDLSSRPGGGTKLMVDIPVVVIEGVCFAEQTLTNLSSD